MIKLTSISEIAKDIGVNKSKLTYYVSKGLIPIAGYVGRMHLFERNEVLEVLKKIDKKKASGKSLSEIAKELNAK